eukprot:1312973-Pleurochrysis_carterae.AAC.1
MKPTLRRPSRRCLLRRGALRRELYAISAWLHVAIGAETFVERGGRWHGAAAVAVSTRAGWKVRRTRAPSMEGMPTAKSIAASLNRSSTLSMKRAVLKISWCGHANQFDRAHSTIKCGIEIETRNVSH